MERDPSRIDPVLQAIRKVWAEYPDMRLGQLLVNAIAPKEPCAELYSIEDMVLIRKLVKLADRLKKSE
jgi:hypothetical protein